MDWGSPVVILLFVMISTFGWVATSWIRARHGYPLEGEWGGKVEKLTDDHKRQTELLAGENDRLKSALLRVEERVAVLERIVTEPGARVAKEIEALR